MKMTAAATTVIRLSALSSRFVDVAVVSSAQPTIAAVATSSGPRPIRQVRFRDVIQNTAAASSRMASARNASSFGKRKGSLPLVMIAGITRAPAARTARAVRSAPASRKDPSAAARFRVCIDEHLTTPPLKFDASRPVH